MADTFMIEAQVGQTAKKAENEGRFPLTGTLVGTRTKRRRAARMIQRVMKKGATLNFGVREQIAATSWRAAEAWKKETIKWRAMAMFANGRNSLWTKTGGKVSALAILLNQIDRDTSIFTRGGPVQRPATFDNDTSLT